MSQVDEFHYHDAWIDGKRLHVAHPTAARDCGQCRPYAIVADILRQDVPVQGSNVCVANCDTLARKLVDTLGLAEWFEQWTVDQ